MSLATPIKLSGLKLSKPRRRVVVQFLDGVPALEADLLRYKGLWVKLSGWLHPGDFAKAYPKVAAAFDHLRNERVQSFESPVAQADALGKVTLLQQRPSLSIRQLAHLLKNVEPIDLETTLRSLGADLDRLPLPLLLTAFKGVQYRGQRLVINKAGKSYTIGGRVDRTDTDSVFKVLDQLILDKLKGTKDWSTVWLDPALHKLVLPLQARKQPDRLLNLGRGSRVPVSTNVLRLFVYWQDAGTDLDLSVLRLDQNFRVTGHVAFNQYGSDPAIRHSGDIQSAPFGAAEFVDLRLDSVQDAYLLISILKHRGKPFPKLQACYAGWQHRQDFTQNTLTFDAKTVAEKVNVQQDGAVWLPILVDVAHRELVWVDLYTKGSNTIERNPHYPGIVSRLADYCSARPTYGELAQWTMRANSATQVSDRAQAAVTIGTTDNCIVNIMRLVGAGVTQLSQ